jgi:hypothetical protein
MCRAPPRSRAALRQATCHPSTCPAASRPRTGLSLPRHVARRLPEPRFTAARRRSDSSATSCFRRPHASLPCLAAALPTLCCLAPRPPRRTAAPELHRAATRIAGATAPAWAQPHPLLDPEHSMLLNLF